MPFLVNKKLLICGYQVLCVISLDAINHNYMKNSVGQKAPNFELEDEEGKTHTLEHYKGQYLLLYFYPKDMTSGCTVEAQCFRNRMNDFKSFGVQVLGVSCDDTKSHKKFAEKEKLNFPLLADVDKKVVNAYGVWVEKSMYGKKYMGIQRDTFLIDPAEKIVKHYVKVKPETHIEEVLKDLEGL